MDQITARSEYISVTDTAKLIRQQVRKNFPGTKFSVRSDSYAGGASIRVSWTDGPSESAVKAITGGYTGGRFDGMIDMAYNVQSWLLPDGTAHLAHDPGTGGQRGSNPESVGSPMHPDARMVHFGANYVFTNREITDELADKLGERAHPGRDTHETMDYCRGCAQRIYEDFWQPDTENSITHKCCSRRCAGRETARLEGKQ